MVILFPSDWVRQFGVNLVTAHPKTGGGRFRYYERLRPLLSFSAIVEKMLAGDLEFRSHHIGEQLRIITHEGEYGAWVRIDGLRAGSPAMRCIGAVFMDDFATALDCVAITTDRFSEFERLSLELLHGASFEMTQRPRPFFYVPPVGWQGIPAGLVANFYPLDFPRNRTNIVVPPATLLDADEESIIEAGLSQLEAGLNVESAVREPFISASGHRGTYKRLVGYRDGLQEPIYRELALFVVQPYRYELRLETTNTPRLLELREVLCCVAGSFRPLPAADERRLGRAFFRADNVLEHWAS